MARRYTIQAAVRAAKEPGRIVGELRRIGTRINAKINGLQSRDSFDVMNADWDILLILDGCRYDLFKEQNTLDGETSKVISAGSDSIGFIEANFNRTSHHDTVYVTANPFAKRLHEGTFHAVKKVYATHWSDEFGTVRPESVADVSCDVADKFPNKRIIVHFMQPHYPFITETGKQFDSGNLRFENGGDIWTLLQNNRCPVSEELVWKAYEENYRILEPVIRRIDSEITGQTVVTADHGNLVGERLSPIPVQCYGHPPGTRHPHLITVPWHKMPTGQRRKITKDAPKKVENTEKNQIEERLKALGYT